MKEKYIKDYELAKILKIQTKALNRLVKRNKNKFSESMIKQENYSISKKAWGGRRSLVSLYNEEAAVMIATLIKNPSPVSKEKLLADFIKKDFSIIEEGLIMEKQENRFSTNKRVDFLLKDKTGRPVLLEIQIGQLDRIHLYKSLEYRDFYFVEHKINPRVILMANEISSYYKKIIKIHKVEFVKIPEFFIGEKKRPTRDHVGIKKMIKNFFKEK